MLDAETGEVKALVGGRSYGVSQLNHASRQAAAGIVVQAVRLCGGVQRRARSAQATQVLTPATTVIDEANHFLVRRRHPYEPANFGNKYRRRCDRCGMRWRIRMNVPAVKVAEMVGYDKVADVARAVGLNRGHPAHAVHRAGRL